MYYPGFVLQFRRQRQNAIFVSGVSVNPWNFCRSIEQFVPFSCTMSERTKDFNDISLLELYCCFLISSVNFLTLSV